MGSNLGIYSVAVRGFNVPMPPAKYALVVSGDIQTVGSTSCAGAQAICPMACSGQGQCNNGVCACNTGFTGLDCSSAAISLLSSANAVQGVQSLTKQARLSSGAWVYYSVAIPTFSTLQLPSSNSTTSSALDLLVTVTRVSRVGDPDIYVGMNYFPTLSRYDVMDGACDTWYFLSSVPFRFFLLRVFCRWLN